MKRITANVSAGDPKYLAKFYCDLFGLKVQMEHSFISAIGAPDKMPVQLNLASEGGSGTPLPALSIEVDDLDAALERARALNADIEYGPVSEPWGLRRFFLRDPAGTLVNVLQHDD